MSHYLDSFQRLIEILSWTLQDLIFQMDQFRETQSADERNSLCVHLSHPELGAFLIKADTKDVLLPVTWQIFRWHNLRKQDKRQIEPHLSQKHLQAHHRVLYPVFPITHRYKLLLLGLIITFKPARENSTNTFASLSPLTVSKAFAHHAFCKILRINVRSWKWLNIVRQCTFATHDTPITDSLLVIHTARIWIFSQIRSNTTLVHYDSVCIKRRWVSQWTWGIICLCHQHELLILVT